MEKGEENRSLPGEMLKAIVETVQKSGGNLSRLELSNDDLDRLYPLNAEPPLFLEITDVPPVQWIGVNGLTRFSEIYTHPNSRADTLRRLNTALTVAQALGARGVILGVKEVVPAEVALPAYRVGLKDAAERARNAGLRVALEPIGGWDPEEAADLTEGLAGTGIHLYEGD